MHSLSQHLRNVITHAHTAEKLSPSTVSLPPPSLPLSLSLSLNTPNPPPWQLYYAQIYQYRYLPTPRVVLPDRALCLPTFCHSLQAVNKTSSSSSPTSPLSRQAESTNLTTNTPEAESCPRGASAGGGGLCHGLLLGSGIACSNVLPVHHAPHLLQVLGPHVLVLEIVLFLFFLNALGCLVSGVRQRVFVCGLQSAYSI